MRKCLFAIALAAACGGDPSLETPDAAEPPDAGDDPDGAPPPVDTIDVEVTVSFECWFEQSPACAAPDQRPPGSLRTRVRPCQLAASSLAERYEPAPGLHLAEAHQVGLDDVALPDEPTCVTVHYDHDDDGALSPGDVISTEELEIEADATIVEVASVLTMDRTIWTASRPVPDVDLDGPPHGVGEERPVHLRVRDSTQLLSDEILGIDRPGTIRTDVCFIVNGKRPREIFVEEAVEAGTLQVLLTLEDSDQIIAVSEELVVADVPGFDPDQHPFEHLVAFRGAIDRPEPFGVTAFAGDWSFPDFGETWMLVVNLDLVPSTLALWDHAFPPCDEDPPGSDAPVYTSDPLAPGASIDSLVPQFRAIEYIEGVRIPMYSCGFELPDGSIFTPFSPDVSMIVYAENLGDRGLYAFANIQLRDGATVRAAPRRTRAPR
jgi:hypothetical protein